MGPPLCGSKAPCNTVVAVLVQLCPLQAAQGAPASPLGRMRRCARAWALTHCWSLLPWFPRLTWLLACPKGGLTHQCRADQCQEQFGPELGILACRPWQPNACLRPLQRPPADTPNLAWAWRCSLPFNADSLCGLLLWGRTHMPAPKGGLAAAGCHVAVTGHA